MEKFRASGSRNVIPPLAEPPLGMGQTTHADIHNTRLYHRATDHGSYEVEPTLGVSGSWRRSWDLIHQKIVDRLGQVSCSCLCAWKSRGFWVSAIPESCLTVPRLGRVATNHRLEVIAMMVVMSII